LKGQDVLNINKTNETVLEFIRAYFLHLKDYSNLESKIKTILALKVSSVSKWESIHKELITAEPKIKSNFHFKYTKTELCLNEIKLNFVYPRLDINVSKHINHLLKSPFCVHPKTGLISVPLNEDDIVNFDLNKIPSIESAIDDFRDDNK
jgi:DNA primase small subunit